MDEIIPFSDALVFGERPEFYRIAYNNLVKNARDNRSFRDNTNEYLELHHIVPKCMGGTDEDDNLIPLSYREHVIAHCLLWLGDQENSSLALAVQSMLLLKEGVGRDYGDISDLISRVVEIRKLSMNTWCRSVACLHHETQEVLKVYPTITSTSEDGFSPSNVGKAVRSGEKSTSAGYCWRYTEEIDTSDYDGKISSGWVPNVKFDEDYANEVSRGVREFVGFLEDLSIVKTYPRLISVREDGFEHKTVLAIVNKFSENFKYHKGYRWMLKDEFIKLYPDISDTHKNLEPREDHYNIICCNRENKILKIYKNQNEIELDGFNHHSLNHRLTTLGVHDYCGYL